MEVNQHLLNRKDINTYSALTDLGAEQNLHRSPGMEVKADLKFRHRELECKAKLARLHASTS